MPRLKGSETYCLPDRSRDKLDGEVSWKESIPPVRKFKWLILTGASLVLMSGLCYTLQIVMFKDPRNTFFYLLQDVAFVPVQVLLVTLLVNEVLKEREKSALHHKLNMVIGAFFSEVGDDLLRALAALDKNKDSLRAGIPLSPVSTSADLADIRRFMKSHDWSVSIPTEELARLRELLVSRREFILTLLENQNLLEHESFTDLLWAVSHLTQELHLRSGFADLPKPDIEHLANDAKRAYAALAIEWLSYVEHLREQYPYIYSLVTRMNPFDPGAHPEFD